MADQENKKVTVIAARERGPGPGRYALPSTCGYENHDYSKLMRPAYSFGKRLNSTIGKPDSSPGPVYFVNPRITRHGSDGTPSYSILGRQKDPKMFKTPSPGAHSPEKVHPQGERHAPVHSMGARTRYRKQDSNPAPNRYQLPPLIGPKQPTNNSCPSYSVTGRSAVGSYCEDLSKTPGPGQYHAVEPNVIRTKRPQYSLQGRSKMAGDNCLKPGPGAHSPEKVNINKPSIPCYSLGIRHSEFVTPMLTGIA